MKFIKSGFAKKLIIVLVILISFNAVCPEPIYAWDVGGILLSPIYNLVAAVLVSIDTLFGCIIFLADYQSQMDNIGSAIDGDTGGIGRFIIGPDTIFSGRIRSFNANIFKQLDAGNGAEGADTLAGVAKAVAKFYVLLRNLAAIVMLGGLIFTGIRILISANIPTKKAQWLTYLQDWLMGMILLIFSHIIMILILEMSEVITLALSKGMMEGNLKLTILTRMLDSRDSVEQLMSLILYLWMGWLTIVFAIAYFKRFFWTCILIIFAPVMCVMYAFGQQTKQIYNNWLKDFITNAFVQPFHMIVYTVLVTLPLTLTNSGEFSFGNIAIGGVGSPKMLYALVAMCMIKPAEKYMRQLFGLDKGIANMASYDSGKQTIVNAAKKAIGIGAAVATGGASLSALASAGALGSGVKMASEAAKLFGQAGEKLLGGETTEVLDDPEKEQRKYYAEHPEEAIAQIAVGGNDNALQQSSLEDESDSGIAERIAQGVAQGMDAAKLNSQDQLNAANVLINAGTVNMDGGSPIKAANTYQELQENSSENTTSESESVEKIDLTRDEFEIDEGDSKGSGFLGRMRGKLSAISEAANSPEMADKKYDIFKAAFGPENSVSSTLYVDGTQPNASQSLMGVFDMKHQLNSEKRKEDRERAKDNWANNSANISIMKEKYLPKYREEMEEKYGSSKSAGYKENKAQEKAEAKAKSALKDMSAYVPYGITDVNTAYSLYKNANEKGLSPEQSLRNMGGFERFNNNSSNVTSINQNINYSGNNYTQVSQAIPNAREYYDAGYSKINEMQWLDYMSERLGKSPQYAMKLDEALKKRGGGFDYKGKDLDMKKVVEEINKHYKKKTPSNDEN